MPAPKLNQAISNLSQRIGTSGIKNAELIKNHYTPDEIRYACKTLPRCMYCRRLLHDTELPFKVCEKCPRTTTEEQALANLMLGFE